MGIYDPRGETYVHLYIDLLEDVLKSEHINSEGI